MRGLIFHDTKDNFARALEMGKEYGFQIIEIKIVIITRVIIKTIRKADSVCIVGKMELNTKDIFWTISNTDKVLLVIQMEIQQGFNG